MHTHLHACNSILTLPNLYLMKWALDPFQFSFHPSYATKTVLVALTDVTHRWNKVGQHCTFNMINYGQHRNLCGSLEVAILIPYALETEHGARGDGRGFQYAPLDMWGSSRGNPSPAANIYMLLLTQLAWSFRAWVQGEIDMFVSLVHF